MSEAQTVVAFPESADGARSSSALGRKVAADALREVDPTGARPAEQETAWRTGWRGWTAGSCSGATCTPTGPRRSGCPWRSTPNGPKHEHPWQDEAYAAVHGGLWRAAYAPRSVLGLAALGYGNARG